jgi:hypothetical protein
MYDIPKPEELREFLRSHDLTGSAAAALLGVEARTVRKWTASKDADNRRRMPWSAWALLQILVKDATPAEILREIEKPRPA